MDFLVTERLSAEQSSMNKFSHIVFLFLIGCFYQVTIFAQKNAVTELPMQFRGQMPAIEVMVNGKGPFLFAIDTGAQGTLRIDTSLVETLGLKKNGEIRAGDGSGQNLRALDTVGVDSVKIGGLEFTKLTAIIRNYNNSPGDTHIDGILGFGLFADHLLTLDYPGKRVRIEKGELAVANGKDILSFDSSREIPIVELLVGEQKVRAHIDSGNMAGGFILPAAVVEKAKLASEAVVVGRAKTVSNEIEIKQAKLKDPIRLGEFEFPEPTVVFPSLSDANIGSGILREFAIAFDQKNKRIKLQRTKQAKENLSQPSAVPLTPILKDLVGKYGDRTISGKGSDLYIQRPNGMKLKLISLSKDEFTLEQVPAARIKFVRDEKGAVTGIQVLNAAGVWESAKKDAP
jgi:predicted aspartyl protease